METELYDEIREHLTPDLLDSFWREAYVKDGWPTGYCYVASYAYYLLAEDENLMPMILSICGEAYHWYLEDAVTGEVIDLTADQFDVTPIYGGTPTPFGKVSADVRELVDRVRASLNMTLPLVNQ